MTAALSRVPRRYAAALAVWLIPVLFLLWLYWDGFSCWFIADDFAWLGLIRHVNNARDVIRILFESAAQGTIRPWSERGFFLLFESLFGMDNLPFRIMVFVTMAADLALLGWIVFRITRSYVGACVAGVVWSANAALVTVMTWTSSYNEALCPFFLLAALALFVRWAETGKRKFWWWQLVVFILGFGALELNVVYPVIAASWALFIAPREARRRLLLSVTPLVGISVVYYLVHRALAPLPAGGPYAIHIDARIFSAFLLYGKWSLLPEDWRAFDYSPIWGQMILWTVIVALAGLFVAELVRRRGTVCFFITWFLATLGPMLILPDHHSDYYLTIPLIGLAMLAAWAFCCAWRGHGRIWQIAPGIAIAVYLAGMIPVAQSATEWALNRSEPIRGLVMGTAAARAAHPGKTILLDGITRPLYEQSVGQGAFYPLGIDDVYLTPESGAALGGVDGMADTERTVLEPGAALHAAINDQVVIYSIAGDHLRNITDLYERSVLKRFADRLPSRVDVGNPLYSWLLGPEWLAPLDGVRWMPERASLHLYGPQAPEDKLILEGTCLEEQLQRGPLHLRVVLDRIPLSETQINDPETHFRRLFSLPASALGKKSVEVEIQVDPVIRKDGQAYGLVFGKVAIRH